MSNPAQALISLFASWNIPSGQNAINTRLAAADEDLETMWSVHGSAVGLLLDLVAELDAMEAAGDDVSAYREYVTAWYSGIFSYSAGWTDGQNQARTTVPADALAMLRALALLISKTGQQSLGSPTKRASLLECIQGAVALIETELDDWDRGEKEYLYRIVAAARAMLEQRAVVGETDLQSLVNELIGALTGIALDLRSAEGQDSTRFQNFMRWIGTTAGVMRGIIYDADAVASLTSSVGDITRQLGPGA